MVETNAGYSGNNTSKINKEFHSTFATIVVTVLSIMLAFYGITVVILAQQAQTTRQNEQNSEANVIGYLKQTDSAIRSLAYIVEPPINASDSWTISNERYDNMFEICDPYSKSNMSFSELSNSDVNSLLGNYSLAMQEDEAARDWLNSLNITRFKASYNLAEFSLHDIVNMLYLQFPSPPDYANALRTGVFVSSNFSDVGSFIDWFQNFTAFYDDVSTVHAAINDSIVGISQAYLDAAKLNSEELDQLKAENSTNSWDIEATGEIMTYEKAMATYYSTVFDALDAIFSSGASAETNINQYNLYASQYNLIYQTAGFPLVGLSVGLMICSGVISITLLGQANSMESRLNSKNWRSAYKILILLSIVLFLAGVTIGWIVLANQISKLIPPS